MESSDESQRSASQFDGSVSIVCRGDGQSYCLCGETLLQRNMLTAGQVAGNVANLPAHDMNNVALSFLAARTLYIGLYMGIKSNALSYARTGVYAWSISIPIMCLWRAGKAIGQDPV